MRGDRSGPRLTAPGLAEESGVDVEYVQRLVEAAALHPDQDGLHELEDVLQIQLVQALADVGIEFEDVVWAIREARLPLDRIASTWTLAQSSGRSFAEFAASLGEQRRHLPAIYAAFGLAVPTPETIMRRDEEEVLVGFLEVWGMLDDRPDVYVRAARIAGEGVRRLELAMLDLFDEWAERRRRASGRGSRRKRRYAPRSSSARTWSRRSSGCTGGRRRTRSSSASSRVCRARPRARGTQGDTAFFLCPRSMNGKPRLRSLPWRRRARQRRGASSSAELVHATERTAVQDQPHGQVCTRDEPLAFVLRCGRRPRA